MSIYKIKWNFWKLKIRIQKFCNKKWIQKFETDAKEKNIDLSNYSDLDKLNIAIQIKQIKKTFSGKKYGAKL